MEKSDIIACRLCLATETRLYAIRETGMEDAFVNITGFKFSTLDGLPSHLCPLCLTQLSKYAAFRDRCRRSHELLETMKAWGQLKMSDITAVKRHALRLTLDLTYANVYEFNTNDNIIPATVAKIQPTKGKITIDNGHIFKWGGQMSVFNDTVDVVRENRKENDTDEVHKRIYEPIETQELGDGFSMAVYSLNTKVLTNAAATDNHILDSDVENADESIDLSDEDVSPLSLNTESQDAGPPWPILRPAPKQPIANQIHNGLRSSVSQPALALKGLDSVIEIIDDDISEPFNIEEFIVFNPTKPKRVIDSNCKARAEQSRKDDKAINKQKFEKIIRKVIIKSPKTTVGNIKCKRKVGEELNGGNDVGSSNKLPIVKVARRTVRKVKLVEGFDYETFEKQYNFKRRVLTEEEQRQEIETMKTNANYLNNCYRCDLCGKGYNYEETYKNHMVYHDPRHGAFECQICHIRYRAKHKLKSHAECHRVMFTCNECGCVIRGARNRAKDHFGTHIGKYYKCPHCDKQYLRRVSLVNHIRLIHPGKNIACDECGDTFVSAKGVLSHKNKTHRLNALKPKTDSECATCRIQFHDTDALRKHTRTASDATHVSCKPCVSCGENCRDDEALATHAAECRRREKQVYCAECDKTFVNVASYDTHYRRKHQDERCRSLVGGEQAYVERRRVPQSGAFHCDICRKLFSSKKYLTVHMRSHQAIKPFECDYCGKKFATKFQIKLHIHTHTGAKPFKCRVCGRRFSAAANLYRHARIHSGSRPYLCTICGKTFACITGLNTHTRYTHMGEKYEPRKRTRNTKVRGAKR